MPQDIPERIRLRLKHYGDWGHQWTTAAYGLAFIGIALAAITSALNAAHLNETQPVLLAILGAAGAICTGILVASNAQTKKERYGMAWEYLNRACLKYEAGQSDLAELVRAMEMSDGILNGQIQSPVSLLKK